MRNDQYLRTGETLLAGNRAFFAIMQGDGNFVVYKGTGPGDNRGFMWHTNVTSPVTWLIGGKKIVSVKVGRPMHWADYSGEGYRSWLLDATPVQKFVLLPDTTIRWAHDSSYCMQIHPGYMEHITRWGWEPSAPGNGHVQRIDESSRMAILEH